MSKSSKHTSPQSSKKAHKSKSKAVPQFKAAAFETRGTSVNPEATAAVTAPELYSPSDFAALPADIETEAELEALTVNNTEADTAIDSVAASIEIAVDDFEHAIVTDTGTASAGNNSEVQSPENTVLSATHVSPSARSRRRLWGFRMVIAGLVLLAIAIGLRWYAQPRSDAASLMAQNKALVAEVAKLALLPTGETPSVTTVVDKSQVSQAFLQNAQNGDKVLLYYQAHKAYVYRPSTRQIVNIGPLTQPAALVFLRSGNGTGKIPVSVSDTFNDPVAYRLVSTDVSPRKSYKQTVVVDLTGRRPDIAARIAQVVGGKVSTLPDGESSPDAEFLVIVGTDAK